MHVRKSGEPRDHLTRLSPMDSETPWFRTPHHAEQREACSIGSSGPTRSSPCSAPVAWARSIAPVTRSSVRDVAIKILPSQFTADPERRSRFAREARLLATLWVTALRISVLARWRSLPTALISRTRQTNDSICGHWTSSTRRPSAAPRSTSPREGHHATCSFHQTDRRASTAAAPGGTF